VGSVIAAPWGKRQRCAQMDKSDEIYCCWRATALSALPRTRVHKSSRHVEENDATVPPHDVYQIEGQRVIATAHRLRSYPDAHTR
jgi:hypothetical protein